MDLIGKPRSKSVVWMYFGFRADENGFPLRSDEVICRLCRKIVLAKGGNTTNLRSHLKRRHRAEVANTPFSASLGIGPETQGLDQSHDELIHELQSLSAQADTSQNYVPDAVLPPGDPWIHGGPPRAVLSLPSCLCLSEYSRPHMSSPSSESYTRDKKVYARCQLQLGTMFGPYVGEMSKGHVPDNLTYAWAIRDESSFTYVDGSDPNKSNWMRFVTFTSFEDEQNLTVFQFYRKIYYKVSQPVSEGDELKVWVGRDYASLLGLEHTGENMKCQVGDKESFLRPLQDIQFSTLPEPTSSSHWSDHSQSQSPMPIISEVTSINTGGSIDHSSPAVPSSSLGFCPIPHPYENKYHFLPGTERLVASPDHPHPPTSGDGSLWYFFGFEPDHTGRPLDRTTAICKLCGDLVGCGSGGVHEIRSHMMIKHNIKPRESTSTGSLRLSSVHRAVLPVTTATSVNLTDNILYFLIMDLHPPSLVRGKGFQHLINTLLPHKLDLPSKTKLDYLLNDLHAKGKTNIARMLRTKEDATDYRAPLEGERNRRKKDVPHLVNFSVDVWFHTWQGNTEMYLSLWVHYIDANFTCHNRALASQKLSKSGLNLKAVESQVRAMAEVWGISQANLTVLGGEGWNDIRAVPMMSDNVGEATGSTTHPNSTTFLERDDSTSPVEQENRVENQTFEGLPSVPCFFTAVQSCVDDLISMNAVSKVLSKFQNILVELFTEPIQTGANSETFADHFLQGMTSEEQVEVKIWVHSRPTWNKLYLLLNTLLKHKALLRDILNKLKEDTGSESSSDNSTTTANSQSLRTEWKVVEDLCLVLKPLDVACQTLAKEEFPRLSLIKPILTGLLSRHLVTRPGDSPILKEAKTMMRYNLSHWYDTPAVIRVLNVACALDPQFHGLCFMSEKEQTDTFQWLKNEAVRISNENQTKKRVKKPHQVHKRSPSPSTGEESKRRSKRLKDCLPINFRDLEDSEGSDIDPNDSEWVEPPPEDGLSGMEFLLGDLYSTGNRSQQRSVEESVDLEINVFQSDNGALPGVEPLQWWRSKTMQLPLLAAVAKTYLAAPAVAGNGTLGYLQEGTGTSRGKRSNIPPENLDAILFLHHNNIHKTKLKLY